MPLDTSMPAFKPDTTAKAWMKPPPGVKAEPEELENPSERLVEVLSAGWSQFTPESAKESATEQPEPAKKSGLVEIPLATDKPARGLTFGDTDAPMTNREVK